MNRKEKIKLLQEVEGGNKKALEKLKPSIIVILNNGVYKFENKEYTDLIELKKKYHIQNIIKIIGI